MAPVSKKILWVSIGLVLVFGTVAITLSYQSEKEMPSGLKAVLDNCACQESGGPCTQPGLRWNNETHNINNNTCKWGTSSGVNLEIQPRKSLDIIPLDDGSQYNAAVTGDTAETICRFLDIPCPVDPKFRAKYDFTEQNGRFSHYINDEHYSFKITNGDTILVYSTYLNAWVTLNEYKKFEKEVHPDSMGFVSKTSCSVDMINHLLEYSNIFEVNDYFIPSPIASLPEGMNPDAFDVCWEELLELKYK